LVAWEKDSIEVDICTIGTKGSSFFAGINANLVAQIGKLGDTPHLDDIVGIIKVMLDSYSTTIRADCSQALFSTTP
jgi:F-type H+-transporting ATPase subunit gamma